MYFVAGISAALSADTALPPHPPSNNIPNMHPMKLRTFMFPDSHPSFTGSLRQKTKIMLRGEVQKNPLRFRAQGMKRIF
jgi:hypothetical protein